MTTKAVRSFAELRDKARDAGPKRVGVVVADDAVALSAAAGALRLGIAVPVLIGDEGKIRAAAAGHDGLSQGAEIVAAENAAAAGVAMAAAGRLDILLKGHLRTDELLHAVLDKNAGLTTGRLLSDVLLYEDTLSGAVRLVGITDGGLNIAPDLAQKQQIVRNAIEVFHGLGFARPKIAVMSATEAVSDAVPSTVHAAALAEMGQKGEFGAAEVFGPFALDNALLKSAAEAKGISNPVAGEADCLVVPTIEAGNLLGKAVKYLAGSQCAHVVVGAKVPVLIPSRVESADDKINAIALGVLHGRS